MYFSVREIRMAWLLEPFWVVAVALAATAVAVLESTRSRWAPFMIFFPAFSILLPVCLGSYAFGNPAEAFGNHRGSLAALALLMWAWEIGLWILAYEKILLPRLSRKGDPRLDPGAALSLLARRAAERHGMKVTTSMSALFAYACIWAPIGEELFYWGYMFGNLRPVAGLWPTALLVSALFAARHAGHMFYLRPETPSMATAVICLTAFGAAMVNSLLYEVSGSLYPLMLLHLIDNLFLLAISVGWKPDHA